jgi:intraflagellar transport protein 81
VAVVFSHFPLANIDHFFRELSNINSSVKASMSDIHAKQGKYHLLNQLIHDAEVAQDRSTFCFRTSNHLIPFFTFSITVMNEMKAYIGADEMIELVQKSRGFKSYRDLYTKKIAEAENAAKVLKIEQKEIKVGRSC